MLPFYLHICSHWEDGINDTWGNGIGYLWQLLDEAVNVSRFSSRLYLLHCHSAAVVSIRDVFCQGAVEQHGLLGHNAHLWSQPLDVQPFDIHIVQHLMEKNGSRNSIWVAEIVVFNLQEIHFWPLSFGSSLAPVAF